MKTNRTGYSLIQEIRQNGETKLCSEDGISMRITFKNLTGRNFARKSEYHDYIRFIAIEEMGFTCGEIELIEDGECVAKGYIKQI